MGMQKDFVKLFQHRFVLCLIMMLWIKDLCVIKLIFDVLTKICVHICTRCINRSVIETGNMVVHISQPKTLLLLDHQIDFAWSPAILREMQSLPKTYLFLALFWLVKFLTQTLQALFTLPVCNCCQCPCSTTCSCCMLGCITTYCKAGNLSLVHISYNFEFSDGITFWTSSYRLLEVLQATPPWTRVSFIQTF